VGNSTHMICWIVASWITLSVGLWNVPFGFLTRSTAGIDGEIMVLVLVWWSCNGKCRSTNNYQQNMLLWKQTATWNPIDSTGQHTDTIVIDQWVPATSGGFRWILVRAMMDTVKLLLIHSFQSRAGAMGFWDVWAEGWDQKKHFFHQNIVLCV
jgi:hypothetical protein